MKTTWGQWTALGGAAALCCGVGVASAAPPDQHEQEEPGTSTKERAGERTEEAAGVDEKADRLLRQMSDYLAGLQAFSFVADNTTEVVTDAGQKLDFSATSEVAVKRPDRLRSDRRGDLAKVSFYYDGDELTVFGRKAGLFATAKAPPDLDQAIDFARTRFDLEAPAADLLYSDPYRALMEDVVSGMYVGPSVVDGVPCHHLAFRGQEVDWQIWIADGARPLPHKFVIISKKVPQAPEFAVELSDWNLKPKLSDGMFEFTPPPGAQRVDFLPAPKAGAQKPEGGKT